MKIRNRTGCDGSKHDDTRFITSREENIKFKKHNSKGRDTVQNVNNKYCPRRQLWSSNNLLLFVQAAVNTVTNGHFFIPCTIPIALRGRDVTRSDKQTGNSMQSLLLSPQQQCLVVTIQTAKKDKD